MPTDTERMDFMESLLNRAIFQNKRNPTYYKSTDIHINGPNRCNIFVRNETGGVEYEGHGGSVRESIDDAIEDRIRTFGK